MPAITKRKPKRKPKPKAKPRKPAVDPSTLTSLVKLFGQVDALHWPFRVRDGGRDREALAAVYELKNEYRVHGFSFQIESDGSAAGWKRAQSERESLAATGFCELTTHERRPRLKFTPAGDAHLRDLLHLTSLDEVGLFLRGLFAFQKTDRAMDGVFVSESQLFGDPDYTTENEWNAASELTFPLIIAGAVEAETSTIGQIWYRPLVTESEAKKLITKWKSRPTQRVGKKPKPALLNCYCDSFVAYRKKLRTATPRDPSNIEIPLRATL